MTFIETYHLLKQIRFSPPVVWLQSDAAPVPGATRLTAPDGVTGESLTFGAIASGIGGSLTLTRKVGETI